MSEGERALGGEGIEDASILQGENEE